MSFSRNQKGIKREYVDIGAKTVLGTGDVLLKKGSCLICLRNHQEARVQGPQCMVGRVGGKHVGGHEIREAEGSITARFTMHFTESDFNPGFCWK